MKRFWFSIIVVLFAFDARAQSLHDKILVVIDTAFHGTGSMLQAAGRFYTDSIEVTNFIPKDISNYDAVLLQWNWTITDSASEGRLIDYLKHGGKVYLEGSEYALRVNGVPDAFMQFCGVSRPLPVEAIAIRFRGIHSSSSEFASGLDTEWTVRDPTYYDLPEPWGLDGALVSIMCAQEDGFSECDPIAWRPTDTAVHVVIYWTIAPPLYDKFFQRMLCNYFGLCAPMSVTSNNISAAKFSIAPNPAHTSITISLPPDRESSVEITDVLGSILHSQKASGEMTWQPQGSDGIYFIRVATREADGSLSVSTKRVVFER
jgi:hypothetical protein